jgi:hypothetical protein
MRPIITLKLGILLSMLCTASSLADPGTWVAQSNFAQMNVFCQRLYTCETGKAVMFSADMRLVKSPPQTVRGVCVAGSGPAGSCNQCVTNPPAERCEWSVQKK